MHSSINLASPSNTRLARLSPRRPMRRPARPVRLMRVDREVLTSAHPLAGTFRAWAVVGGTMVMVCHTELHSECHMAACLMERRMFPSPSKICLTFLTSPDLPIKQQFKTRPQQMQPRIRDKLHFSRNGDSNNPSGVNHRAGNPCINPRHRKQMPVFARDTRTRSGKEDGRPGDLIPGPATGTSKARLPVLCNHVNPGPDKCPDGDRVMQIPVSGARETSGVRDSRPLSNSI